MEQHDHTLLADHTGGSVIRAGSLSDLFRPWASAGV